MEYLQDTYFANLNVVCRMGDYFSLEQSRKWNIQERTQTFNKFYYFWEGSCRITMEDKTYIAKAGDWFLIPAGTRHNGFPLPGENFEKYWMHFDLYPNAKLAKALGLPCVVHVGKNRRIAALFQEMIRCNSSDKLTDKLQAKACLLQLLALYVELCDLGCLTVVGEEESRIQEILSYIHNNLSRPLHNAELAELCHMHPSHFIRYFSKMTGQTPAAYVTERRMEAAKRLLENTELPIAQVMEQVGLQEPNHFARLFRKYYYMTPREYRKQVSPNYPNG